MRGRKQTRGRGPQGSEASLPQWIPLAGLLVLVQALVLTLVHTPMPHPGGDNMAYLSLGWALASGLGYMEVWDPGLADHAKYTPGFPVLLAGLILLGVESWVGFKLVVAGLVSLAVLLAFFWANGRAGPWAGGAVAVLTLLSAGWLEASRWILSEPLFLVVVFGAFVLAGRAGMEGPLRGGSNGARDRGVGRVDDTGGGSPPGGRRPWIPAAVVLGLALLAFLVRTAGFPLVLAVLGALVLRKRFREAAVGGIASALVLGLWSLRARDQGEGAYQSEFWMANPYDPAAGTLGIPDLVGRILRNLEIYVGRVLPGEWWGAAPTALLWVLGLGLAGLALVGWGRRILRREPGVPELFLPLYAGLILVWPEVWSGDRFVLVLYPLLLLWAGEALHELAGRVGLARRGALVVVAGAAVLLGGPAVPQLRAMADNAARCRSVGSVDPFQCLGQAQVEFRAAAAWAGRHLPDDAVVLNRKPRIFRALGGTRGQVFPFSTDTEDLLRLADRIGARYLLVDAWDGISLRYLPPLVQGRPGAFCWINRWGDVTDLLGILPPGERDGEELRMCPPEYLAPASREVPGIGGEPEVSDPAPPHRVPLLSDPPRR